MVRVVAQETGLTATFRSKLAEDEFAMQALALAKADEADTQSHIAPEVSQEEALAAEGQKRAVQLRVGMGDAENLSGGLQGAGAAEAARRRAKSEEKEAKQRFADAQLQALLDQLGAIDAEIEGLREQIAIYESKIDILNDTIAALNNGEIDVATAMSNPDVRDAIKDWERRTGQKFDPNSENAADVMAAILSAQVDQYRSDISEMERRISTLDVERAALVEQIKERDASFEDRPEEIRAESRSDAKTEYNVSDTIGSESKTDVLVSDGREAQDDHRDAQVSSDEDVAALDTGFGGFSALSNAASPRLAEVKEDLSNQWQTASAVPEGETANDFESTPEFNQMPIVGA